jgi:hypothetical protein
MDPALRFELSRLIADLSAGRWLEIAADGRMGRLTLAELSSAVAGYGRTLVLIPDDGWSLVDVIPQGKDECLIDMPLWTHEEGRSDLTLSLSATRSETGFALAIDDLHVM